MTNRFEPQAGMYFYVEIKPKNRNVQNMMGDITTVVQQNNSYRGYIFYCIATDDYTIVCESVYAGLQNAGHNFDKFVMVREDHKFIPVGPDVMKTLRPHFVHKHSLMQTAGVEE